MNNKEYEITKRMSQYHIARGIFYKYAFKCTENEKLQVLFYYSNKREVLQFENIVMSDEFKCIFNEYIKMTKISNNYFEIVFTNGSIIRFVRALECVRGYRYHYAVVNATIDKDIFDNVIRPSGVLYPVNDLSKIDVIEM